MSEVRIETDARFIFELVLHEVLIRQGYRIVEVEPELANGRRPDFLVEAPAGQRCYVEATIASDLGGVDAGTDRRLREARLGGVRAEIPCWRGLAGGRRVESDPVAKGVERHGEMQGKTPLSRGAESHAEPPCVL